MTTELASLEFLVDELILEPDGADLGTYAARLGKAAVAARELSALLGSSARSGAM